MLHTKLTKMTVICG